ncbi:MAG: ABC transporter permease subunit [Spirochaetaceae bacterium]
METKGIIKSLQIHGKTIRQDWTLYILLLPMLIWYCLFAYKPMGGLLIAFQDYSVFKGMSGSTWVGLENFRQFMGSDDFFRTVKNTLFITGYRIVFAFPASIILALMINELKYKWLKNTVQTVSFLPYFISIVVVCGMVINFLSPSSGIVNTLIKKLGGESVYFMVKAEYFRQIYTSMIVWRETGFNAIVYIAALAGIDQQLYEAAKVDGAGKWSQMVHITIPSIMPTIVIMFVLNIGKMINIGFESIILLYQPATFETSDVISTFVYRMGIQQQQFGVATAAGLFEAFIALALVLFSNKISKKLTDSSLL